MKLCKILGDLRSQNLSENYPVILLCDHCYHADTKRGEDAQVVSYDQFNSNYSVSCEVCYKSLEEEREEHVL